ncbi:MAG: lycopene cyclase domain-containing protein [Patescibacteria group bacterium]
MVQYKYAYLVANLFFLAVWLLIFWRAGKLRKPMLVMSLITAFFGPISEIWYFADYWKPEIALPLPLIGGAEDLLFGFSIGGIGAFAYESLFVRGLCKCEEKKLKREWFLLVFFVVVGGMMIIFNNLLGLNSIFASSLAMIILAAIMLALRPDLLPNAIGSALLVAGVMFIIYFLGQEFFPSAHLWMLQIWKLSGTPQGIVIFKHIPWTEMLWGLSWGLVWGPMYEFLVGARVITLKPNKKRLVLLTILFLGAIAWLFLSIKAPKGRDFVEEGIVCTMEVRECPDGSYVGRVGPRCEFAPCPNWSKNSLP